MSVHSHNLFSFRIKFAQIQPFLAGAPQASLGPAARTWLPASCRAVTTLGGVVFIVSIVLGISPVSTVSNVMVTLTIWAPGTPRGSRAWPSPSRSGRPWASTAFCPPGSRPWTSRSGPSCPLPVRHLRPPGRALHEEPAALPGPPQPVHVPRRPPRQEREALLQAALREHDGADAHRLHAHCRPGLPETGPGLQETTGQGGRAVGRERNKGLEGLVGLAAGHGYYISDISGFGGFGGSGNSEGLGESAP